MSARCVRVGHPAGSRRASSARGKITRSSVFTHQRVRLRREARRGRCVRVRDGPKCARERIQELVRAHQALLPLQHALAVPRVPDLRGERHHHDERREQTDGQRDGVDSHRASKVARPASRAPICRSKRRRTFMSHARIALSQNDDTRKFVVNLTTRLQYCFPRNALRASPRTCPPRRRRRR